MTTRDHARTVCLLALLTIGICLVSPVVHAASYRVLHHFEGTDGAYPHSTMVLDSDGILHGTAQRGGLSDAGTLFEIARTGYGFRVNHHFGQGPGDGWNALGDLLLAASGTIYGTLAQGGPNDAGGIFTYDTTNDYQILRFLDGGRSGVSTSTGVTLGPDGTLYGTAYFGGHPRCNCGTVFKIDPYTNELIVLHAFRGVDGGLPRSALVLVGDTLYGTTVSGGPVGHGLPYSVKTDGSDYTMYVPDEGRSFYGGLTLDDEGNLWGAAAFGGEGNAGGIYRITPDGMYEWRASLRRGQGRYTLGKLLLADDGLLYGNACNGGSPEELGTIYRFDPETNLIERLFRFDGEHGSYPSTGILQDSDGVFYGTTDGGGMFGYGVIYSFEF